MNALDFHQPPPQARSLEEAQALIDQLWMLGRVVQDQQARIEELEEQLGLDSGASSKPPSSDDAKARAERRKTRRSCSSARSFASGFLQTLPHGSALAIR